MLKVSVKIDIYQSLTKEDEKRKRQTLLKQDEFERKTQKEGRSSIRR